MSPADPPASESAVLGTSVRERMLERFARWLDEALTAEDPPAGLAAEILAEMQREDDAVPDAVGSGDLYHLWSGMTALAQEVKLQSRAFHDLSGAVAVLPRLENGIVEAGQAHTEALLLATRVAEDARLARADADRLALREARRAGQREIVDALLDVRDRLARGLESARAISRGRTSQAGAETSRSNSVRTRLSRLFGRFVTPGAAPQDGALEVVQALENGYRIGQDRVAESLDRLGIREIEAANTAFDPHRMTAVDSVECSPEVPDGTVLEVLRAGYVWGAEVLRPAQVKVAKSSSNAGVRPEHARSDR